MMPNGAWACYPSQDRVAGFETIPPAFASDSRICSSVVSQTAIQIWKASAQQHSQVDALCVVVQLTPIDCQPRSPRKWLWYAAFIKQILCVVSHAAFNRGCAVRCSRLALRSLQEPSSRSTYESGLQKNAYRLLHKTRSRLRSALQAQSSDSAGLRLCISLSENSIAAFVSR